MPSGESASRRRAVSRNSGASLNILAFKHMENDLAVLKWLKTDTFTQGALGFTGQMNAGGEMQIGKEAEGTVLLWCCFYPSSKTNAFYGYTPTRTNKPSCHHLGNQHE